jgi:hypothetical protein
LEDDARVLPDLRRFDAFDRAAFLMELTPDAHICAALSGDPILQSRTF